MAIIITDECINCGACEPECPNNAIYEGGIEWAMVDGTTLTGSYPLQNGHQVDVDQKQEPISEDFYYIVPDKCTECWFSRRTTVRCRVPRGLLCSGSRSRRQ